MPICYLIVGWLGEKDVPVKNKDAFLAFVRDDIFCERGMLVFLWQVLKRSYLKANVIHVTHSKKS